MDLVKILKINEQGNIEVEPQYKEFVEKAANCVQSLPGHWYDLLIRSEGYMEEMMRFSEKDGRQFNLNVNLLPFVVYNMRVLVADNRGITEIDSISCLANLETLSLQNNKISDISCLTKFPNLRSVYLDTNPINDISVLKEIPNLKIIGISGTMVTDISALKNLKGLEKLYITDTQIEKLDALNGLHKLKTLAVTDTPISKDEIKNFKSRHPNCEVIGYSGCFIATACYGSYNSPEVLILRKFRDEQLSKSFAGRGIIELYYSISPPLAAFLYTRKKLRQFVKKYIINPIIRKIKNEQL